MDKETAPGPSRKDTAHSEGSATAAASGSTSPPAGVCPFGHGGGSKEGRPWPLVTADKPKKPKSGIMTTFSKLRTQSKRPLPTQFGNGTYPVVQTRPGRKAELSALSMTDIKALLHVVKAKLKGETVTDDKTMIMEKLIALVAGLPHQSMLREKLTNNLIAQLWNSLEHPPMLYVGDKFRYRIPDGSNNNPMFPMLGAANTHYARSCKPRKAAPGALPDPNQIFEALFARTNFKQHPNNVSSILWYWATIITHDLFWTDKADDTKNKASSYLDLSPLYGSNQEMLDSVRSFRNGLLKPDAIADKRLIGVPPGVTVLLIMFNRFHNHVADMLAAINEGGRFTKPSTDLEDESPASKAAWKKYDEDLFQTARLVTSGLYINITLVDYVRNIVNLNRVDTTWTLDPRQEAGASVGTPEGGAAAGVGNVVSVEFDLCYRWHSCISDKDDKWVQEFYGNILAGGGGDKSKAASANGGGPPPPNAMAAMMRKFAEFEQSIPDDPAERTFAHYKRGPDGKFSDDDLAECITSAIEDPAGAFGARNVPQVMRPVEILGILRGRKWNVAGLNEFRNHFGLKPYAKFEDINSDPEVADALRHLYDHPDNVELYPGIVAEEAKTPMVPGVGIAPTYTISRVVLSDAVALVRGDRYYTTDFTPRNLTAWGYNEVNYDLNVNHGCVFYKLFLRALPNHFKQNSVYAHYPMVIPGENSMILKSLGRDHLFDFGRPQFTSPRVNITSYGCAKRILEDKDTYRVTWHEGLSFLMGEGGSKFMLSGDTDFHESQRKCMAGILYQDGWEDAIRDFYAQGMTRFLRERSYKLAGKTQVDIIRDVGNMLHTHFAARMFNLPLKTAANPKGIFTEKELYEVLSAIFVTIFFDIDPVKSFPLRQYTKEVTVPTGKLIEANVKLTRGLGIRGLYTGKAIKGDALSAYGVNMIKALGKAGLSNYDITWSHVLPTAGAMVPNQAEVFAQAIDFYLEGSRAQLRAEIATVAAQPQSKETDALLLGYAMEGIRLAGTFGSYRQASRDDVLVEDDGREVPVPAGARVFVSFVSAARDPNRFPDPDTVDPRRDINTYIHYGFGPHACLGRAASQIAITEMFRALFRKKNLRRAPGAAGELKKVPRPGGFYVYMKEDWSQMWPFPVSMKVQWDEEE
jgi:cytochrome P450